MAELIIVFREVLEASLIIGILYTYLKKSNNEDSIKMLWSGVGIAVFISIIASIIFHIFLMIVKKCHLDLNLMSGK